MKKRLYLSRTDKKLAGVCGGISEYFDIDVTLVRLLWVLFSISGGAGVVVYIIAAIIMTEAPRNYTPNSKYKDAQDAEIIDEVNHRDQNDTDEDGFIEIKTKKESKTKRSDGDNLLIGGILVVLGSFLFSRNFLGWHWINFRFLSPMVLIAVGVVVILNGRK